MTAQKSRRVIAVDLGATKVAVARAEIRAHGRLEAVRFAERPLPRLEEPAEELQAVTDALLDLDDAATCGTKIVVSLAPAVRDGAVVAWPNRPAWAGFAVATELSRILRGPIVALPDGDAAALADAGDDAEVCFLSLHLGTGVAGGVVRDGQPLRWGPLSPEFGHLSTRRDGPRCVCGARGCLQAAWVEHRTGRSSVAEFADDLAAHLTAVSRMLPSCVVTFSGRNVLPGSAAGEELLQSVRARLPRDPWAPEVRLSEAGPHAPLRGALAYAARLNGEQL